jgi:hypothetical protein
MSVSMEVLLREPLFGALGSLRRPELVDAILDQFASLDEVIELISVQHLRSTTAPYPTSDYPSKPANPHSQERTKP